MYAVEERCYVGVNMGGQIVLADGDVELNWDAETPNHVELSCLDESVEAYLPVAYFDLESLRRFVEMASQGEAEVEAAGVELEAEHV